MQSMGVTSREAVRLLSEQLWLQFVPILHRLQGRLAAQGRLRQLLVAEPDVAVQRGFEVLARPDVVALQHLLDPAVEALDHAVGPGRCGRRRAVFDAQFGAEPVELGRARRGTSAQASLRASGLRTCAPAHPAQVRTWCAPPISA
jgi:hypothetical protein